MFQVRYRLNYLKFSLPNDSTASNTANRSTTETTSDISPDLEDLVGSHPSCDPELKQKHEAFISVDGSDSGKMQHKSTILRILSNPLAAKGSKDRLKRVRGFSAYEISQQPSTSSAIFTPLTFNPVNNFSTMNGPDDFAAKIPSLFLEDPVLTLVGCNRQIFLAAILVASITYQGTSTTSLSYQFLHEPTTKIRGQIMHLRNVSSFTPPSLNDREVLHSDNTDWEWTGGFEPLPGLLQARDFEGRWIELVGPIVKPSQRSGNEYQQTYHFHSLTLCAASAILFERIRSIGELGKLPNVPLSITYPYRHEGMWLILLYAY